VIEDEKNLIDHQFTKNDIQIVSGLARFKDAELIEVVDGTGQVQQHICAEKVLIATGSKPRNPLEVPFDGTTILDSDHLLHMDHLPKSMMVLGGGIIGTEYATMFAALGTRVILVDKATRPLEFLDKEISACFVEYIQQMGVEFKLGRPVVDIHKTQDGYAEVELEGGEKVQAESLFAALGRIAHVEGLDLHHAGIELNDRDYIPVNALF
jgi:NAD(P) transhydrogenase